MFPTFIGILDIQSWWEVPSIAHFCSLFRAAFNLLDFDIEDLEEALLTDGGTEGRLLQELIVKLLEGCLPNDTRNDISTFNYQMFLRRLFRKKCQEYKCENPFNTDVDFELLPLRQKVEILRALCDFRLDAEDVEQSLNNLDSDSLRVEPLGHDRKNSAYWYFYGTRLYREDYIDTSNSASHKQKSKPKDKKRKKRRNRVAKEEEEEKEETSLIDSETKGRESVWQVVCFTQQDWSRLVEKFRDSEYDTERKLYRTLSEDFMPEIPKLFDLKEKQQRRKLLQRNSSRVLRSQEPTTHMDAVMVRSKIKTKTNKGTKKGTQQGSKTTYIKEDSTPPLPTPPIQKKGRQTNNSLASAVGQIVIHTRDEVEDLEKKKGISNQGDGNYVSCNYGYKYGYSFRIEEEERCVGMHKVLESIKDHVDAWPFIDPVDEEYAPRYYSVVRKPMDLSTMEEKLEGGSYKSLSQFKHDFRLIIDNCRQYNGSDNEYTEMAINLKEAFDKAVSRYLESETSSDEDPTSLRSLAGTPTSPSYPPHHLSSSHHNTRKRSKKSTKKSKSYKPENRTKSKTNEKVDEDEKRNKSIKVAKKKRGKKKGKKAREEELDEDEEEQEDQESEGAISGTSIVMSKRRKNVDVNSLLKTKKLSKESEGLKTSNKKGSKERHQSKKDSEIVRSVKETKENKKRKEDFEEDYESPVKSKSRKIEKKELEETGILTDNTKKSKLKKIEIEESDVIFEEDKKQSSHVKTKKNRKKEKMNSKTATKADEKSDKIHIKQKDKRLKQKKNEELKNGELKKQTDPKDIGLESTLDSKHTHISKKLSTLIGNKDVDSLDSLKDKISDRRREEKLKNEKEKQRKTVKSNTHTYSIKVPSISNIFHDYDKDSVKRSKSKKGTKEDKTVDADTIKKQESEINENKKVHAKYTKGMEENSTIQALNQATEKTLHDINKWLDDAPKLCGFSSGSDSPVLHIPPIESGRSGSKIEITTRKRPSSIKIFGPHGPSRPKKIQRTIDRLQPGKSKGNLLLKKPLNLPSTNTNDTAAYAANDNDQSSKGLDEEPKLSLGTVLKNVDSIHLICKSLVSSPNLSNDDEEEDHALTPSNVKEEKTLGVKGTKTSSAAEDKETIQSKNTEEAQKPKSATPNLSAWFKAFGAPKSKKKDEEVEETAPTKKDGDLQEVFCGRQRRLSTGGSSVSESVSSFSQESPPAIPRAARSPQCQPAMTPTEPIRGAGFYQDALSTGSSPYNSPYYATPPRYSAQLPPTPSPQNPHPLSPAYPSSYEQQSPVYPQVHTQPPYQSPYQKTSPQENTNEAYSQMSPQRFPQQLPANNQNQSPVYPQHSPQPMQPVYPQPSDRTPPSNYSQASQQPPTQNYSQPSPQQNAVANYSQPSPQAVVNYPQASPQQHSLFPQSSPQTPPNYSQPSPQQQQHSPYAQSSPQQPAGYGRLSPQPPPVNYSQSSPQPPSGYSQPSPQPPNFSPQSSSQTRSVSYSQSSPSQPLNSSFPTPPQLDRNYSQSSHQQQQMQTFPQHASPQTQTSSFSEQSPQNSPYSQTSPQSLTNYSHQSSPQQPPTYSHPLHSPQTPPNYSQLSPQQTPGTATVANYSQPSPQQSCSYSQSSPQRKPACNPATPSQQSPSYSQSSPQQTANYSQLHPKNSDPAATPSATYPQDFKQNPTYVQQSPTISSSVSESDHRTEYLKSNVTEKPATGDQQRNFPIQSESSLNLNAANHQIYQSSGQYPPTYPNSFSNVELQRSASRHSGGQQQTQQQSTPQESRPGFMEIQPRGGYLGKTAPSNNSGEQLPAPSPNQLRAFQENLTTAHESLYPSGFQSGYPLPPPNSRPVYPSPHYFDAGSKSAGGGGASGSPNSNPPPMKKRAYESASSGSGDASSSHGLSQESATARPSQEQFPSFDPMMTLPQSEISVSVSQYDGTPTFVGGLADSMAANPAYARLSLGLVGRTPPDRKEQQQQQQLLTIPRPPPATKAEHLAAYGRGTATGATELEQLNLLQSLAQKNSQGILAISRGRAGEGDARTAPSAATMTPSTATPSKTKRSRKSKHPQQQEQQNAAVVTAITTTAVDQQQAASIAAFPQYADSIGALKTAAAVPPAGSAFNFAASTSGTTAAPSFAYDKDATAAAAFAFLTDEFRNPTSYYNMALRQQQQQQQQQQQPPPVPPTVTNASGQPTACNKLGNQPPRNYPPPHPFLHTAAAAAAAAQRSYVSPVSAYVTPHGPNLMDQAAYQQYLHSLYALQPPPPHHHRPSWL